MTDLASAFSLRRPAAATGAPGSRIWALYAIVFVAAGLGALVALSAVKSSVEWEDSLVLLLRFMAGMKALMGLAALALTHWRFRRPAPVAFSIGYVFALALMALAPGLIWSLGHIALGAALFHAGLLAFLVLAWRDDGALLPFGIASIRR